MLVHHNSSSDSVARFEAPNWALTRTESRRDCHEGTWKAFLSTSSQVSLDFLQDVPMYYLAHFVDSLVCMEIAPVEFHVLLHEVGFNDETEPLCLFGSTIQVRTFLIEPIPTRFSDSALVDPPGNSPELGGAVMFDGVDEVNCDRAVWGSLKDLGFQPFKGEQLNRVPIHGNGQGRIDQKFRAD